MSHRLGYFFMGLAIQVFRFVPFGVLYVLSDGLAFLLYHLIRYRRKVVFGNLRRVFPQKTDAELGRIARGSYRNLTDLTLETVKAFTMTEAELQRRCPCRNPELVNQYLDREQPVIIGGSHFNNWELACLTIPAGFHGPAITVYKPLTNKMIDRYFNRNRARGGMLMVSMDAVFSAMRKQKGEAAAWLMVADQSPSSRKSAHWVPFLGQDSASLPGIDVLARKFNFPVLYFDIQRLRRGFYELHYSELWPDPSQAAEGDITRAYALRVEKPILKQPENWLWSHKRWKIRR